MERLRKRLGHDLRGSFIYRRYYFLWRNKINTNRTDFENMTEEEFRERWEMSEIQWENLKKWEETQQYTDLMFMLADARLGQDLIEVYEAVKEKAKGEGSGATVKAFLDLQKVIQNRNTIKDVEEEKEEDDGLEI